MYPPVVKGGWKIHLIHRRFPARHGGTPLRHPPFSVGIFHKHHPASSGYHGVDLTLRIHVALTCLRCSIRCFCLKEAVRQGTAEDGSPSIEKCCSPWSLDCDNPFLSLPGDPFVSDQYLVSHCSVYQCPTDTGSGARFEPRPLYPVWNLG